MRVPKGKADEEGYGSKEPLVLLVDPLETWEHPDLEYLLSFDGVAGVEVWRLTSLQDRDADGATARLLSSAGGKDCWVRPYQRFKRAAAGLAERSDRHASRGPAMARAMALAFLSERQKADGVVSEVGSAVEDHHGLISGQKVLSVPQALAVIGAKMRLLPVVSLGGSPNFTAPRTLVYPRTVSTLVPTARLWANHFRPQLAGGELGRTLVGTVLWRAEQALRARDNLHEGIRLLEGEAAVDEALCHFDVVLTSAMASFDAFARALREPLKLEIQEHRCGLQKPNFRKCLRSVRPGLASLLEGGNEVGARIRFISRLRNQIHGVAPSEVLYVNVVENLFEHRVVMSSDVANRVSEVFPGPRAALEAHGLFLADGPAVNLAMLTETITGWMFSVLDAVMVEALPPEARTKPTAESGQDLWPSGIGDILTILARVGSYPTHPGIGIPASPGTRRRSLQAYAAGMRPVRPLANESEGEGREA